MVFAPVKISFIKKCADSNRTNAFIILYTFAHCVQKSRNFWVLTSALCARALSGNFWTFRQANPNSPTWSRAPAKRWSDISITSAWWPQGPEDCGLDPHPWCTIWIDRWTNVWWLPKKCTLLDQSTCNLIIFFNW